MDMDFAVSCPLVRHWRLVSGFCPSTRTFDPCFFQTPPRGGSPCIITRPSPPSGWPEDLHLQTAEHAQHTTKPLARRTLARDSTWQGNCDVADQPSRSNTASFRIIFPIEYPMSNCPAKFRAASFKRPYRKCPGGQVQRRARGSSRRGTSDRVLTFRANCRGRDDHCWPPPAQIRTCAFTHTALTEDEWRRSAYRDRGAERGGQESTGPAVG
jgi:hypothetical protein